MTECVTTLVQYFDEDDRIVLTRSEIDTLKLQFEELRNDILFLKNIFLKKQAKKQKRREKKELERVEIEKEKKAREMRSRYEDIVWQVTHRLWDFMPNPQNVLSPKENELVWWLAKGRGDYDIAMQMKLRESSVSARICAINKKIGLSTRQDLIAYYSEYQKGLREHRHIRCLTLLSWLLYPPPGFFHRPNLRIAWLRRLGPGQSFHYVGSHVPGRVFDSFRDYEHTVLKLKSQGFDNAVIAERLKIKVTTVRSYLGEIRGGIRLMAGVNITSDKELISHYRKYQKRKASRGDR